MFGYGAIARNIPFMTPLMSAAVERHRIQPGAVDLRSTRDGDSYFGAWQTWLHPAQRLV